MTDLTHPCHSHLTLRCEERLDLVHLLLVRGSRSSCHLGLLEGGEIERLRDLLSLSLRLQLLLVSGR